MSVTTVGTDRYNPRVDPVSGSSGGGGTAVMFAVQNVAAIGALDTTPFQDGSVVGMRSVLDNWQLNRESVLAPDGITVAAALNLGGNWERQYTTNAEWKNRTVWYVDAVAGNDENDGATALTALRTIAEWRRRVGRDGAVVNSTVNIVSNISEDVVSTEGSHVANTVTPRVTFIGVRTTVYSGTVSAVTAYDPALPAGSGTMGNFSDAGIPVSFTASGLVDKMMVLTSGAHVGAVGFITKDLGAKTARFSPLWDNANDINCEPAVNDTYDVVTLTTVTGSFEKVGSAVVLVQDLRFTSSSPSADVMLCSGRTTLRYVECTGDIGLVVHQGAEADTQGCMIAPVTVESEVNGTYDIACTYFKGWGVMVDNGSFSLNFPSLIQAPAGSDGVMVHNGGVFRNLGGWLAIADAPGMDACVSLEQVSHGTIVDYVFGTNNNVQWFFQVQGGCVLSTSNVAFFNAGGVAAVNDVVVGTVTAAYAALPTSDIANLAGIVLVS